MFKIKSGILCAALISIFISCSPTGTVTESTAGGTFPAWYQSSGFAADSLSFSAFATAIASDSLTAISRAEDQAAANLENYVSEKLETVRNQIVEEGSVNARSADFILTLRNAHAPVEAQANLAESSATENENYFRGFAKASIHKEELLSLLEAGFSGKSSFWDEMSNSASFSEEFE